MSNKAVTTSPNPKSFLYEERGAVAVITLNRPDRLNSLTFEVYRELSETLKALRSRKEVRVVVITGRGRGFCSGGDVEEIIGELFKRDINGLLEFTLMTCDVIRNIRALDKPVIGALNGTVAGAGAVIALACDLRIAAETANIAFLFVKVGLAGADMGAAFLLPKVVGLSKATEMLYTGDFISAEEAAHIGLYNKVVTARELEREAMRWAEQLAAGPAFALAMTKAALNRELGMSLETALEAESKAQAICMLNPDFREAYEAFKEKRAPVFNKTGSATKDDAQGSI
ncbi:MAG TPA: enoyl-CoA hydratase family protein [Blastocatellia bacterium]|nr:enoyl-CoA hydratase family protein [Blastocatellia bacterium]